NLILISVLTVTGQSVSAAGLDEVLIKQSAETRARYDARHPKETLEFFGIKPGMTVIEALPGGGWYSKILLEYLGPDGLLIGADYARSMYPKFNFYPDEYIEKKKTWARDWTLGALKWHGNQGANISAFPFGSMTDDVAGKVDAVLLIRAMHNLARYETDGGYLSTALKEIYRALKPGGIVGIVQHQAPESAPDAWASGDNGYLKKSFVKASMEKAGFVFDGESAINENPADQPTENDVVWRLPPTLYTSKDNAALRKQMEAIGESNRMTLRFRKPK
ncbi:MAG: class I SAM-dependent methyltransferase, partial [Gammaproteobacteria bacterium]